MKESDCPCVQVPHSLKGGVEIDIRKRLMNNPGQFMSRNTWEGLRESGPLVGEYEDFVIIELTLPAHPLFG